MNQGYVKSDFKDGILTIEFSHPNHNALPGNLLDQLTSQLHEASEKKEVEIIQLKSAGDRVFCAGADFNELRSIQNVEEGKSFFSGFANVIDAIRSNKKLVVGRIQGKAVGGGVGLAAAVDIAFATKYAAIRLSELNIGIGPFVIEPAVARKVGKSIFSNLALQPLLWMSAEQALNSGLYAEIFEDTQKLDEHLEGYLHQLAQYNPEALSAMKKVLWEGCENWPALMDERAQLSGQMVLSEFTNIALKKI